MSWAALAQSGHAFRKFPVVRWETRFWHQNDTIWQSLGTIGSSYRRDVGGLRYDLTTRGPTCA